MKQVTYRLEDEYGSLATKPAKDVASGIAAALAGTEEIIPECGSQEELVALVDKEFPDWEKLGCCIVEVTREDGLVTRRCIKGWWVDKGPQKGEGID